MSFSHAGFSPDASRLLGASQGTEAIKIWETDQYQNLRKRQGECILFNRLRAVKMGGLKTRR